MPRARKVPPAYGSGPKKRARKPTMAKAKHRTIVTEREDETQVLLGSPETSLPNSLDSAVMLPECLDSAAASAVKEMLLARRGSPLVVDASQVRRVGAQSLQVLIAAARTWQADGQSYRLTNSSTELLDTLTLIGLPRESLLLEGTTP
jgi:chemotaxis protein CheX